MRQEKQETWTKPTARSASSMESYNQRVQQTELVGTEEAKEAAQTAERRSTLDYSRCSVLHAKHQSAQSRPTTRHAGTSYRRPIRLPQLHPQNRRSWTRYRQGY